MKPRTLGLLPALALLAACASGLPQKDMPSAAARYMEFAGDPVSSVSYLRIDGWQSVGRDKLVLWTGMKDGYLLSVESCPNLEFTNRIRLTTQLGHSIQSGF